METLQWIDKLSERARQETVPATDILAPRLAPVTYRLPRTALSLSAAGSVAAACLLLAMGLRAACHQHNHSLYQQLFFGHDDRAVFPIEDGRELSMSTPQLIPPPRDLSGRRALLIWGAVLVLSGSGIGAGSALLFQRPAPPPPIIQPRPESEPGVPNFSPAPIVSQMSHELNLTSDQTEQVTAAYTQSLSAIRALRADMIVKLNAEHEKLRAAMKKTLTDAQFADWDRHFEAMRTRFMPDAPPWREFHHHDHGGPGGEMRGPDGHGRWMGEGLNGDGPGPQNGPDSRSRPGQGGPPFPRPGPGQFDGNDSAPPRSDAPGGPQKDRSPQNQDEQPNPPTGGNQPPPPPPQ